VNSSTQFPTYDYSIFDVKNNIQEKSVAFRSLSCQKIRRSGVSSLVIVRTTTILAVVVPRDHE